MHHLYCDLSNIQFQINNIQLHKQLDAECRFLSPDLICVCFNQTSTICQIISEAHLGKVQFWKHFKKKELEDCEFDELFNNIDIQILEYTYIVVFNLLSQNSPSNI